MANAPSLVNSFVAVFGQFHGGGFTSAERQVLLLSNAVTNRCVWAVAFHSTAALAAGVAATDVEAIRRGELPANGRLALEMKAFRRVHRAGGARQRRPRWAASREPA